MRDEIVFDVIRSLSNSWTATAMLDDLIESNFSTPSICLIQKENKYVIKLILDLVAKRYPEQLEKIKLHLTFA